MAVGGGVAGVPGLGGRGAHRDAGARAAQGARRGSKRVKRTGSQVCWGLGAHALASRRGRASG